MVGPLKSVGWKDANGKIQLTAAAAGLLIAVVRIPA